MWMQLLTLEREVEVLELLSEMTMDAAFDTGTESGSTGVIIRDDKGQWVAAAYSFLPHLIDAPMAEHMHLKKD